MRPRLYAVVAGGAFAAGFASLALLQHRAYRTGRFDVGNLVQAVWSTAHGDLLSVTDLEGRQISRLGAHFDPIVVLFAPLWRVWPDASALLVAQAAAVALGAVPAYLLARKHTGSEWAAAGLATTYLLYPATQWLVVDDFHPVTLATPLLLAAIWFLDEHRLGWFSVCALAACATKEHVGLTVAALGAWYALAHGRRRAGAAVAGAALAVAVVASQVVVPHFAPGGGSPFEGRYAAVGGGPAGIASTAVTDPGRLVGVLAEGRDARYLAALLLPLLCLPLAAPLLAAAAVPELLLNTLSSTPTQTSIRFHYAATSVAVLVAAAALGAGRVARAPRSRRALLSVLVAASLGAGILLGPMPQWRHVPLGSTAGTRDHVPGAHARAVAAALALVPAGAPVSATNTLGAHLSERRRIFSFPVLREAEWVAVDVSRPSYRDRADAAGAFARALADLRAGGRYRLVLARDGVLVFRRR